MNSETATIEVSPFKYVESCMVCDKTLCEYDYPMQNYPKLCDECKKAIMFARSLMDRNEDEDKRCLKFT